MKVRIPSHERVTLLRALATMFNAGIPLHSSLEIISEAAEHTATKVACQQLSQEVYNGRSFSVALKKTGAFSAFQVAMVEAALKAGALPVVLSDLADYEETRNKELARLKAALVYPSLTLALCMVLLIVGPPYLLKAQFELLDGLGVEVPWFVQMMQKVSQLIWSAPFFIVVGCALAGLLAWLRKPGSRQLLLRLANFIPGLSKVLRGIALARYARALSLQLRAGITLLEALPPAAASTGHPLMIEGTATAVTALLEGKDVVVSLKKNSYLPRTFIEFVTVGDEAGKTEEMMQWMAEFYRSEFERTLSQGLDALQPLVMLLTGVVTGAVVLATMLPMVRAIEAL